MGGMGKILINGVMFIISIFSNFCLPLAGFPILLFFLLGEPYKRGFFCDDESLKHPFHDSTVRNWMLYFIGAVIPVGVVSDRLGWMDWVGYGGWLMDDSPKLCQAAVGYLSEDCAIASSSVVGTMEL